MNKIKPYPEGKERKDINKSFDKFFQTLKGKDHFKNDDKKIERGYKDR